MSDVVLRRTQVTLVGGRELDVAVAGATEGPAVVFHHGTPGSSFDAPDFIGAAASAGLRIVAPTRAGYGSSTRDAGRTISSVAGDTREMLDALDINRFVAIGWSGGGPHALACGALLADRCVAAISLAGVAPYAPEDFNWTEGMGPENVEELTLALEGGPAYDEMLETFRTALLALDANDLTSLRDIYGGLISDADNDATSIDAVRYTLENTKIGLRPGIGGFHDDDQAFLKPWGFELEDIRVPVSIWFGGQDLMVPATHGGYLAAHIPNARSREFPDDGHFSSWMPRVGELFEEAIDLAGGRW